jgi:hypothetical protein
MFKPITSIVFILVLGTQSFKGGWVVLNYYTNTVSFAKNCINKAKPKLHCNGKCQLMKKLQQEEKKEQQVPERSFENETTVCVKSVFVAGDLVPVKFVSLPKTLYRPKGNFSNHNAEIFHPPKFS